MGARAIAYRVLVQVEKGAYANLVLDEILQKSGLTGPDRRLATEIVYGTIKNQLKLDWIIGQLVKKAGKLEAGPRLLLRMAFYQLIFLDRIPPSAVTNETVKIAKKNFHQGIAGLINGVLRSYLREPQKVTWPDEEKDPLTYLEVTYSHPRWMLERWLGRYGFENTRKICSFNNLPADLWIRTNTLQIGRKELEARLVLEGCSVEESTRVPEGLLLKDCPPLGKLESFLKGLFTVQDESSMLVAHIVSPEEGLAVLDVCAGPGGKTTHLAQLMNNKGEILACDVHQHRLKLIEENAERLGIDIIRTLLQDALDIDPRKFKKYSLILVDAPCSGLGVLRRRPDSRWRKSLEDIKALALIQSRIMEKAVKVLAPGGRLIYSTCTMEPEENQELIFSVLKNNPDLRLLDLTKFLPYCPDNAAETEELQAGYRQYLPFKDHMEGFFIAGIEKVGLDSYGPE